MEGFVWCFSTPVPNFPAITHAAHDSTEACSVHPWCPGTCAACLGTACPSHILGAHGRIACVSTHPCTPGLHAGACRMSWAPGLGCVQAGLARHMSAEEGGATWRGPGHIGECRGLLKMARACGWRAGRVGECRCTWRKAAVCLGGVTCLKENTWWFSNLCTIISYQKSHVCSNLSKNPLSNSQ